MSIEIFFLILIIIFILYFLFRPTSKEEKDNLESKNNWRGGF